MSKISKKLTALALTSAMVMSMGSMALAEDEPSSGYNTEITITSDTSSINLIKDYIRGENTQNDSVSPTETFKFTITPYGVWNAGFKDSTAGAQVAYTVANMPLLSSTAVTDKVTVDETNRNNVVSIAAASNQAGAAPDVSTEITLSTYNSVGDFWYKVVETNAKTTGVIYGSNSVTTDNGTADITSENGKYSGVYYIHVQVVNTDTKGQYYRSVTLHKTAPAANISNSDYNTWAQDETVNSTTVLGGYNNQDNKLQVVENQYFAGQLVITKTVEGNAGDKDAFFQITVVFTNPSVTGNTTTVKSNITFEANKETTVNGNKTYKSQKYMIKGDDSVTTPENTEVITWSENKATATFYVKDGDTVTFDNIPYGITYTVTEKQPADNTYSVKMEASDRATTDVTSFDGFTGLSTDEGFTETSDFTKYAKGAITDELDTVDITNKKTTTIDIGVILSNSPYFALLACAGAGVVLGRRRKEKIEE